MYLLRHITSVDGVTGGVDGVEDLWSPFAFEASATSLSEVARPAPFDLFVVMVDLVDSSLRAS